MDETLVQYEVCGAVALVRMDNPRRLNGWTVSMQASLSRAFEKAASSPEVGALVLTGTGEYYSAGVDLSGSLKIDHPRRVRQGIVAANRALFHQFIRFPKPMVAAVNGHALGAPVTSAALCDRLLAAEQATFSTPFARLGLCPEGCSSATFPRLMGSSNADRMLKSEGFRPTAQEALEMGLVEQVVSQEALIEAAIEQAASLSGQKRRFRGGFVREELEGINARESEELADAFFSKRFLSGQAKFLRSRNKWAPSLTFSFLRFTRPLWIRAL